MDYKNTSLRSYSTSIIHEELANNHPVIVIGCLTDDPKKGHAWIIDGGYTIGYEVRQPLPEKEIEHVYENYFNCVWGWGGQSNGHYLLSSSYQIGGTSVDQTSPYYVPAPVFENLLLCYGFRPNK